MHIAPINSTNNTSPNNAVNSVREQNRFNMIEQQIRPCNVLNQNVLNTFYKIHREQYVPASYQTLAFAETRLPLTANVKMLTPILEGKILQVLDIKKSDRILLVGTGSGYLTACAANLGAFVTSIDLDANLTTVAAQLLEQQKIANVNCITSSLDALIKNQPDEKYDLIILTGSVQTLPTHFISILKEQGRLFAVIGDAPSMHACVFHNIAGSLQVDNLFETLLERLIGYEDKPTFEF